MNVPADFLQKSVQIGHGDLQPLFFQIGNVLICWRGRGGKVASGGGGRQNFLQSIVWVPEIVHVYGVIQDELVFHSRYECTHLSHSLHLRFTEPIHCSLQNIYRAWPVLRGHLVCAFTQSQILNLTNPNP